MTNSPDERGIDVALMYQPFPFIDTFLVYPGEASAGYPSYERHSLCFGTCHHGRYAACVVVHAPSRRGGERESRPYRLQVASQLAEAVDSIYALQSRAKIIVAGDFNDYHDSPALEYLYQHHLINISAGAQGSHGAKATYRWHGEWRSLDQILLSESMQHPENACRIGDLPFLLEDDEKYGGKNHIAPTWVRGF